MTLAGAGMGLYWFWAGGRLDVLSFYEYALTYSSSFGTLPIQPDEWSALYVFLVATVFFLARHQFKRQRNDPCQGILWLTYAGCVSTYFVARSHYINVQNIFPWLVAAIAGIRFTESPKLRLAQRGIIFAVGVWGLIYFTSLHNDQNARTIDSRLASKQRINLPPLEKVPPEVAQAARAAARSEHFTILNNWALFERSDELGGIDNTLPIGPAQHFLLLDPTRRTQYIVRRTARVPESYILIPSGLDEMVQRVFDKSQDKVELKELQYPFSDQWKLLQVKGISKE